jgi:hypothetical protein
LVPGQRNFSRQIATERRQHPNRRQSLDGPFGDGLRQERIFFKFNAIETFTNKLPTRDKVRFSHIISFNIPVELFFTKETFMT